MSDFIKVNTEDGDELICHRNNIQIKRFNHGGTSAPDFSVKTGQSMEAIGFLEYDRLCKELGVE